MSKSKFQKHQQPLTTLQSMINGVLIETGKALRAANQKGPKTIGHTHAGLQASIPAAVESFHLALDELEIDIVRAKAVLGRDLRDLQTRRNQLENPTTQRIEMADSLSDGGDVLDDFLTHTMGQAAPETSVEADEAIKIEDSITENPDPMKISSPKAEVKENFESPSQNISAHTESDSQDALPKYLETQSREAEGKNDELNDYGSPANPDTTQGLGINISDAAPSASSEAPVTGGLQSATFDELFNGNNGESDLNFDDFDFSGGGSGIQNNNFSGDTGDFDLSSFGNQINDNSDPSSTLPGLDDFGEISGRDLNLLDMSNNSTDNLGAGGNTGNDFDRDMTSGLGAHESIFDDLLDFGDGGDRTSGDMMEHGEYDDNYFGLNNDG